MADELLSQDELETLRGELEKYGVQASIGIAMRDKRGLETAYGVADEAMYAEKRARHGKAR